MTELSGDFESWAFSAVSTDCAAGYYSFAHELAHNMGCAHDRENADDALYDYSYGWRWDGESGTQYRSVMAYAPGERVDHFSNPNVDFDGVATGRPVGEPDAAYSALSINNAALTVANWRHDNSPVLSEPDVSPDVGTTSTVFTYCVHYYDSDGDPPIVHGARLYVDGDVVCEDMVRYSGTAADGTYCCQISGLPEGEHVYSFAFANTQNDVVWTPVYDGPTVYPDSVIEVCTDCSSKECELSLRYSLDGLGGPWIDIPIGDSCHPISVAPEAQVWFSAGSDGPNHEYREFECYEGGESCGSGTQNTWLLGLGSQTVVVTLRVYYDYTPQNYTISGAVLREDGTPVPGGVDFTLSSSQQTLSHHADSSFSFSNALGGVSVTVTPSASGYAFTPSSLVFDCLDGNHTGESITAYSADAYAPRISFVSVPPEVSADSSVCFAWLGEDDISPPASLLYRYKLDGVDADWSPWTSDTSTCYDIPNGAHVFWVTAKDEAPNENQAPVSHTFAVNAAPRVLSAARTPQSIWATRITLSMPVGASQPSDTFVLVEAYHSDMHDPELVPVALHHAGEGAPVGVNEAIADELGLNPNITRAAMGWLVALPEAIPAGQSVDYDIKWGKIQYFGWQEYVAIPAGFRDDAGVEAAYLNEDLTLWRANSKYDGHGTDPNCDNDAWMLMDARDQHHCLVDQTVMRFVRGECWGDRDGRHIKYYSPKAWPSGSNIAMSWRDNRVTRVGSDNQNEWRYGLQVFDDTGATVCSRDGVYYDSAGHHLPRGLIHGAIWIVGKQYAQAGETASAWFDILDPHCNEIVSHTVFDTLPATYWSNMYPVSALSLGDNVILMWERYWDTEDDWRGELCYQVRDPSGGLVRPTECFTPPLLPDTTEGIDEYWWEHTLAACDGKVWASYRHEILGTYEEYYIIFGQDGSIVTGYPVQTAALRSFPACDRDGYIWSTEAGALYLVEADGSIIEARTAAFVPNQNVGNLLASVGVSGYRLYDRWSPEVFDVNVPAGQSVNTMHLFSLNLWDNELYPRDVELREGETVLWPHPGQFSGHIEADLSTPLGEGLHLLSMTQEDYQGGQVLVTFPYVACSPELCDDGDPCTEDACVDDECVNETLTCPDNGDFCTDAACDPNGAEGNCDAVVNVNEGLGCVDSDVCNTGETCQAGLCTGGSSVNCDAYDTYCADHECDSGGAEGNCDSMTPQHNGDSCDDGEFCNGMETCQGGACEDGDDPCPSLAYCDETNDECLGACCLGGGCLQNQRAGFCEDVLEGLYAGDGTGCDDPGLCVNGPCCIDATCVPDQPRENCRGVGGQWAGLFGDCSALTCPLGDIEGDGDVDLADFGAFQICHGGEITDTCAWADIDHDGDLDLDDYAELVAGITGPYP